MELSKEVAAAVRVFGKWELDWRLSMSVVAVIVKKEVHDIY